MIERNLECTCDLQKTNELTFFQFFLSFFARSEIPRPKVFFTCIHLFCSFFYITNIFPFLLELGVVWKLVKCKVVLGIVTMRYVAIGWRRHLKVMARTTQVSTTHLKEQRFPYVSFCKLVLICQISDSIMMHSSITVTRGKIRLKPNPVILKNLLNSIM